MKTYSWLFSLALALSVQSQALELTLSEDPELEEDVKYKTLIMNGEIEPGDANRIRKILSTQLKGGKRTLFLLTSPGGVKEEVQAISKVIRSHSEKSYRNLRKPDVLAINIFCGSACTILTSHIANHRNPKALEFYVQATSGFYIHRPYKLIENGKLVDLTKKKNKDRVFNEMIESYRSAGASPQWLNEISKSIKQSENGVVFKAKALCIS
ncbi:hypothetical protein GW916_01830, partial [bacterium]|nr:hypothetical protein [bacterium]